MDYLNLIKGIGPKTKTYLEKLGIYNVNDLITHYPFRYEVLKRSDFFNLNQGDKIIIDGLVDSVPSIFRFKGKMNKMSFRLRTKEAIINVIIFNRAFLKNHLTINKEITVIGKWDLLKNTVVASDIIFEGIGDSVKIESVYHTTSGLSKKQLLRFIDDALKLNPKIIDYIPAPIALKYNFIEKREALNIIHHPTKAEDVKKAMLRLKYEELFMFMLKVKFLKSKKKNLNQGYSKEIDMEKINSFIENLPFKLTQDQLTAIDEIIEDLSSKKVMNRLLQGDVGSGKTVVAVIAMYIMYLNHYQSALMVPTEILAKQHYANIKKLFKDIDINVELLISATPKKEKEKIYEELEQGRIDLIVGTHAIIQDNVSFSNLGLVVTDEQHRFGVNQRGNLRSKGKQADILYMSATPIPRTYALTIYGDMDITNIKTMPMNRKEIITYLKHPNEIKDVLTMIKSELDMHHQIYVVAPLIEEGESDLENVNKLTRQFELAFGKKYKIGMLHGKMPSVEKTKIMNEYASGNIDILISTTVIEVGVDVKNATMMVIFDAQKFGLSTLHQLRGRVGRSDLQSYCILISDKDTARLKIMTETTDGFEISEEDFKLRGQGDLFGVRQSGDMTFKIADLKKDYKILMQAKKDAETFMEHNMMDDFPEIKKEVEGSFDLD
ncbi:MAG TPA: ATP-dependent DNA helicase RecG [Mollicutes bacterium]|nr:ATP-dependent DNA helicase RecG [Mollicutes bacterium]